MKQRIIKLLRRSRNTCIVEVGAHIGTDTAWLLQNCQGNYRYFAFEPDARDWGALVKFWSQIRVLPFAVSDQNGLSEFNLSFGKIPRGRWKGREHTDSSSLMKPRRNLMPPYVWFGKIQVPTITLDHFDAVFLLDKVDLLWVDVQGAEAKVLKGGKKLLRKTAVIKIECYE